MEDALLAFVGVTLGAFVSLLSTFILSRRQSEITLKTTKISVLQKNVEKYENAIEKLSSVSITTQQGSVNPAGMVSAAMTAFNDKVAAISHCFHLMPIELVENLQRITADVSAHHYQYKTSGTVNQQHFLETFEEIKVAEVELKKELMTRASLWQKELHSVLAIVE